MARDLSCRKERQIGEWALGSLLVSPAARDGARDQRDPFIRALPGPKLAPVKSRVRPADLARPIITACRRYICATLVAEAGRRQSSLREVVIAVVLELARADRRRARHQHQSLIRSE